MMGGLSHYRHAGGAPFVWSKVAIAREKQIKGWRRAKKKSGYLDIQ
ncbi:MAG: hypothetical protein ACJ8I9_09995 [Chthoniobacterales bacterium]|jgi:hypothetical protein